MGVTPFGEPLLLLGLSGEAVTRLVAGEPIAFDLAEIGGPPMLITIVYGRTEDDIVHDLKSMNARRRP